MSKRPLRMTGFARFFFVMILVAPLAYVGASYYNGQDGIQNLKNLLGIDKQEETTSTESTEEEEAPASKIVNQSPSAKALQKENKKLKEDLNYNIRRVEELTKDNDELKRKMESLERTVKEAQKN